jgi:hypothetical protein
MRTLYIFFADGAYIERRVKNANQFRIALKEQEKNNYYGWSLKSESESEIFAKH